MANIIIKAVKETDIVELQKIGKKTFYESYISDDSASDMEQYLNEKFSTEQLRKELKNTESMFYFSIIEDIIVGYLKINIGNTQINNMLNKALEIERIYVDSNYQGKYVGKKLLKKSIELAIKYKIKNIWLSVWEGNPKAIEFYKKNGFTEFDKHAFKFGQEEAINIMMKLELS